MRAVQEVERARTDAHASAIARLDERSRLTTKGLFSGLSRKQKAALWTAAGAAGGVILDGARHLGALLLTLLQHGVRP